MSKDLYMETQEEQLSKEPSAISLELVELEYKFLGWENGWTHRPIELKPCKEAKHELRRYSMGNRGLENIIVCDTCRYYFKYDSSD